MRARHAEYYLGIVAAADGALHGSHPRTAVDTLLPHLAGIRQAWSWAAEHGEPSLPTDALEGLARFWELTCEYSMAEALLAQAAGAVTGRGMTQRSTSSGVPLLLVRLLAWRAIFLERVNRYDEAIEVAEDALRHASGEALPEGLAMAQSVLGEVVLHRQEFPRAFGLLGEAIGAFEGYNAPRQLARALRRLGTAHWRAGDYDLAVRHFHRARDLVGVLGDVWELARIFSTLGGVAYERGDVEEARRETEEALRLYEASGDRRNAAWLQGNLDLVYARLGQYDRALEYNAHLIETSRDLGDRLALTVALDNRASSLFEIGRLDEAYAAQTEAVSVAESMDDAWQMARHRAALGHRLYLRGELDPALAHFEGAVPYQLVNPLLNMAELQLDRGQIREAASLAREAAELASELGLTIELARGQALAERVAAEGR